MLWANFLHFYQPPTQKQYWIDRISDECYRRLINGWLQRPNIRLTLNVNAVLYELWEQYNHGDLIDGLKTLLERGQLEFTASAKFHPLLPKIPEEEVLRQIQLNHTTCQRYLGSAFNPTGFFPPEMAYNRELAKIIARLGFDWTIGEELSYNHGKTSIEYDRLYQIKDIDPKLLMFFRERGASFRILSGELGTQKMLIEALGDRLTNGDYLLTGMDGETFGHHRPGMEQALFELYQTPGIEGVTISELSHKPFPMEEVETLPATWALMEKDLVKNVPFARWEDPENEIQNLQWELTELAINSVNNSSHKQSEDTKILDIDITKEQQQWLKARNLLDRAIHSDQYWWASARPWWSLEMIERGARELKDVVQLVPDVSPEIFAKAQELYYSIITTGFNWQRTGKVDELSLKEDEEVRMNTDAGIPKIPPEELDKMIARVQEEMFAVADKQEYERAAQLRDRIKELEGYKTKSPN